MSADLSSSTRLTAALGSLGLAELEPAFREHLIDDSILGALTDGDLRELGVTRIGQRRRLLAAFAGPGAQGSPGLAPTRAPEIVPAVSKPATPGRKSTPSDPVKATRKSPLVNSLEMPFVPVPGINTLFCVWQVRVRDYAVFCNESHAEFPACDFDQSPDDPVVNVTWHEAIAFSEWLTHRERSRGLISPAYTFTLPSDAEWSAAVGLGQEPGISPLQRDSQIKIYPWGTRFPPPANAGNYHPLLGVDSFPETSPVATFPANDYGIFDLGGNVWEWCLDEYEPQGDTRVLRGASCFNDDPDFLLASYRDHNPPTKRRNNNGFRIVLARLRQNDDW